MGTWLGESPAALFADTQDRPRAQPNRRRHAEHVVRRSALQIVSNASPIVQVPQQRRRLVLEFREAPARQLLQRVT